MKIIYLFFVRYLQTLLAKRVSYRSRLVKTIEYLEKEGNEDPIIWNIFQDWMRKLVEVSIISYVDSWVISFSTEINYFLQFA